MRCHILWRLIWVYTVCSSLSVRLFKVNTIWPRCWTSPFHYPLMSLKTAVWVKTLIRCCILPISDPGIHCLLSPVCSNTQNNDGNFFLSFLSLCILIRITSDWHVGYWDEMFQKQVKTVVFFPIRCISLINGRFHQMHKLFTAPGKRHIQKNIHCENTPIQIYRKFHVQKLKIYRQKTDIFHVSAHNIDCG